MAIGTGWKMMVGIICGPTLNNMQVFGDTRPAATNAGAHVAEHVSGQFEETGRKHPETQTDCKNENLPSYIILYHIISYCIILYYIVLYYIISYKIKLYYIILYCIILYYIWYIYIYVYIYIIYILYIYYIIYIYIIYIYINII